MENYSFQLSFIGLQFSRIAKGFNWLVHKILMAAHPTQNTMLETERAEGGRHALLAERPPPVIIIGAPDLPERY